MIPNLPGDRQFTPRNSGEVEIIIKRKKKHHTPHHRRILRNNYLEVFLVLKTPETLAKSLGNYPLRRVIAGATLFKSISAVFQHTRNIEMIFSKNTSERLLRKLEPVSILHSSKNVSSLIFLIQAGTRSVP